MGLFAPYEPAKRGSSPPGDLSIRPARRDDVSALAALRVERGDSTEADATAWFSRHIGRAYEERALLLAAVVEGTVVGYGNADALTPGTIPSGWYLGGVIVSPAWRRRGIGSRLVGERLAWIADRAPRAYYFVNARNAASIDLHAPFGFVELERGITVPGVTFEGGVGVLYSVELPAPVRAAR